MRGWRLSFRKMLVHDHGHGNWTSAGLGHARLHCKLKSISLTRSRHHTIARFIRAPSETCLSDHSLPSLVNPVFKHLYHIYLDSEHRQHLQQAFRWHQARDTLSLLKTGRNSLHVNMSLNTNMEGLSLSDMSDFEEILTPDEAESVEWNPRSPQSPSPFGAPSASRDRRHPPWSGHRDRLVGIVDMGR